MSQIKTLQIPKEEWERDLEQFNYSLFITPQWIEAVSDSKHIPIYLNMLINNTICGKISGIIIKRMAFGHYLYFYAGPALKEPDQLIYSKCIDAIRIFAAKNSFSKVIIQSSDNKHSLKYSGEYFNINSRVEFVISLGKETESIGFNTRFRRNVNKGEKINPQIKSSNDVTLINTLLALLRSTKEIRVRKYNIDYNPYYLLNFNDNSINKLLKSGLGRFHYTEYKDSIDCMEFNLERGNSVYMLLKGTNEDGYKYNFSSYLSHYLMNHYSQKGFEYYNQGGRPPGPDGDGLAIYKRSMGAEEITVYGASTNFLIYPYKLLNPLLHLAIKYRSKSSFFNYIYNKLY